MRGVRRTAGNRKLGSGLPLTAFKIQRTAQGRPAGQPRRNRQNHKLTARRRCPSRFWRGGYFFGLTISRSLDGLNKGQVMKGFPQAVDLHGKILPFIFVFAFSPLFCEFFDPVFGHVNLSIRRVAKNIAGFNVKILANQIQCILARSGPIFPLCNGCR